MVENLLREYDLFHSSIISGGKVNFNINYTSDNKVYISLISSFNGDEKKSTYDFHNDDNFKKFILPKIIQRFLSKNLGTKIRRIMGNESSGTLVIERHDNKDSLIIRNCSLEVMNLVDSLNNSLKDLSSVDILSGSPIIFDINSNEQYDKYMKYNIIFDYASYNTGFFRDLDSREIDEIEIRVGADSIEHNSSSEQLLILNIARYAYTFENADNVWDEMIETYKNNEKVINICNRFKETEFEFDTTYTKALTLAEFEKNNDLLLHHNNDEVEIALQACDYSVNIFNDSYLAYWRDKERYYTNTLNGKYQAICQDFLNAYDLRENKYKNIEINNRTSKKSRNLIDKFRKINKEKLSFTAIADDNSQNEKPSEQELFNIDKEQILKDALDQAKKIIEIEKERDQLKKEAEEFAKMILAREKEQQELLKAAEEQAKKIIELEKQNQELKKLAELNAKYLIERDQRLQEEEMLREYMENIPVKSQDIDKINNLLNDISEIKELDFAVNHPTTMQELVILEEKIITYLTTHKNIVHEEDKIVPIEKEEMLETKPVIELLAMIRNTYLSSHVFEKDGRHTIINFNPVDEDTFRVSLHSVKDDSEDVLMDAFFEKYQLTDNVLQELCDIFKSDAVIVASKTDNIPPDRADYVVIDNMENAINFIDCSKDLIEKVKEYL